MNHEEMSDAEINISVARFMFVGYEMHIPYKHRNDVHVYHLSGEFVCASPDYCNNPSDAWPIIVGSRIGLVFVNGAWRANSLMAGYDECRHENPLRAAMIVFLMIKDAECQKS